MNVRRMLWRRVLRPIWPALRLVLAKVLEHKGFPSAAAAIRNVRFEEIEEAAE